MQIQLPYQWKPRQYQGKLWDYLRAGGKRACVSWHRRAGKDDVFLHHTACSAHMRKGNYWYMLPEYSQARKSMWDAINPHTGKRRIDESFPLELRARTLENEMTIHLKCGSTFQLIGSDNYNSLVGSPPVGIVFSEYALSNPSAWAYLMPILEENGGWAAFNSTPRGRNHFKAQLEFAQSDENWFSQVLTVAETGVFNDYQLASIKKQMISQHGVEFGTALFLQEYYCSFDAAIMGSIWGDCVSTAKSEGRITSLDPKPHYPVYTAWDLGREDATAIWFFQLVDQWIHVFDYHESNHKDIPFYAQLLRDKKSQYGIEYGTHYLPHDARPRTIAAGGKSILQQFMAENVGKFQIAPRLDVQEGIQAARATFPKAKFDEKRCSQGLEALAAYHHEWDDEKKTFSLTPQHDWASHGADAWRYLSLCWKFHAPRAMEVPLQEGLRKGSIQNVSFGALKNRFLKQKRAERRFS